MKDIFCVDYRDSIRSVVRKEIKVKYGIKVPKSKDREKLKVGEVSNLLVTFLSHWTCRGTNNNSNIPYPFGINLYNAGF